MTEENKNNLNINQILNCLVYTNNPYHETVSANDSFPSAAIYSRLKSLAFICKKCHNGFLPSLDRSECKRPSIISDCKSYSNIECKDCVQNFKRNKSLYREIAFQQKAEEFDKENFFNNFYEFANPYILLDPSQNTYLTRNFDDCKSNESIPNCKVRQSANVCKFCEDGHFLDSDFQCQPNPLEKISFCEKYKSANSCEECITNFVHQKTTSVTLLGKSVDLYNCRALQAGETITNCLIYKQIGTNVMCTRCDDKHFLDSSSLTFVGEVGHANGCVARVDSDFVGGCLQYSPDKDKCEQCVQGLGLSGD